MPEHEEQQEERKPLRYWYDEASDVLVVEGIMFSGDVFRAWMMPPEKLYKFYRPLGRRDLILRTVEPCANCREQFELFPRRCRVCGCSDDNPCRVTFEHLSINPVEYNETSCHWTQEDLCSACAPGSRETRIRGPLPQEELDKARALIAEQLAELDSFEEIRLEPIIELPEPRIVLP